jgi:hypothetical protein
MFFNYNLQVVCSNYFVMNFSLHLKPIPKKGPLIDSSHTKAPPNSISFIVRAFNSQNLGGVIVPLATFASTPSIPFEVLGKEFAISVQ